MSGKFKLGPTPTFSTLLTFLPEKPKFETKADKMLQISYYGKNQHFKCCMLVLAHTVHVFFEGGEGRGEKRFLSQGKTLPEKFFVLFFGEKILFVV